MYLVFDPNALFQSKIIPSARRGFGYLYLFFSRLTLGLISFGVYSLILVMRYLRFFLCSILFGCFTLGCPAQSGWKLKIDKDSIQVYTATSPNSPINDIRVICTTYTSISRLAAVIANVGAYPSWVYGTKTSYLVKQVSSSELYYYAEINFPWPAANRDFVSHVKIQQDTKTKTVSIIAENVPGMVEAKKGVVRILNSVGKWTLTPLGNNQVAVNYFLSVDPGGTLPPWIINAFSVKGPFETFRQLKKYLLDLLTEPTRLSFIAD